MSSKIKITPKEALIAYEEKKLTIAEIAAIYSCSTRTVERRLAEARANDILDSHDEEDVTNLSYKLAKQKQRYQDINRVERKAFRNKTRQDNALMEYDKSLIQVVKEHKLPSGIIKRKTKRKKKVKATGLVHITDTHFNELVDLAMNKYDFNVAAKRLKHYVNQVKLYANALKLDNLLVAFTGDLLNSDRRMDEILTQATNRSKATFIAVSLLQKVLIDLGRDFNVTVANVIGNESRIDPEIGWAEQLASHNYDYTIYNILKLVFKDTDIRFLEGNSVEKVVEVAGQNVLLIHGNQIKSTSMEKSIQNIKGKYSARNVKIDFIILGHLHSCRIGDGFARGASVVGANAYSDSALQLESRASQNFHVLYRNGTRDSIKIDLQNVDDVYGYKIDETIKAYNAKSTNKAKKKVIIQKVA